MSQDWVADLYTTATVADTTLSNMELMFATLKSTNSGATAPANMVAGLVWFDTTANILKLRNEANDAWISVWDLATGKAIDSNLVAGFNAYAAASATASHLVALDASAQFPQSTMAAGTSVQVVNVTDGANASGNTVMPHDDTIPQKTEGDEYMTLAITPTSATNKLLIQVVAYISCGAADTISMCLFQDATAGGLAAVSNIVPANGYTYIMTLNHYMTTGTTSATTFKTRLGSGAGNTMYLNSTAAGRKFGGVASSSITITEIQV